MLKAVLKMLLLSISLVALLAVSGFQMRVDIHRGTVIQPEVGEVQMGRHTPPTTVDPAKVTPSFFDYVRYVMAGGAFTGAAKMQDFVITEGMSDLQKLQYRTDVDRRGTEATGERIDDIMRGAFGMPPTKRGIQFQSP